MTRGTLLAGAAALAFVGAARAASPQSHTEAFDVRQPPARVGEALADVLSDWGQRATFGADCGSWRGPSVDLDIAWRGEYLRLMALLRGDRVAALRYEQTLDGTPGFGQCAAHLDAFQRKWLNAGIAAGAPRDAVYDGPVIRAVREAGRGGLTIGTFEGDYRESRAQCRVALIITEP